MPDQQWGPPSGPYPPQGTPGGGQYPPPGPPQQPSPFQQQRPEPQYQQGYPAGYPQQQYGGYPQQQPPGYQQPNQAMNWGPQFGPPGGPGFPPRKPPKKRSATLPILAGVGGVVALVVVVFAAAALKGDSTPTTEPSPVASYPTAPSPQPTMTPPPVKPTVPKPTVPKPTTPVATRTRPTPPPPRRKPPKPQPTNRQVMTADPFYRTGAMSSIGCRLPDVALSNKAGAQVYYGALLRCLDSGWPRNVRAGHDRFRKPRLLMVAGYVDSPCGGTAMPRSYYCGNNEVIYMRYDQDIKQYNKFPEYYQKVYARMWAMFTVAHEFGHHVQKMTGILDAYDNVRWSGAVSYDVGLQMNRRMELQASCFGNVFVGANKRSLPITGENFRQYDWAISHTIDTEHDHGDADSHAFWSRRGYRSHNPSQCNTFTASSNRVS